MTLSETADASESEVGEAAAAVARYFREALPLHVADEEQSVTPRVSGIDPDLDDALLRMREQHAEHHEPVARLVELADELAAHPERLPALALELSDVARPLVRAFEEHLGLEERWVFPALASLSEETRASVLGEMDARRRSA